MTAIQTEPQPIYEVTTEWHGDIEWAYVVEKTGPGCFAVGWVALPIGEPKEPALRSLKATKTPAEFTQFVKKEEAAMLARIARIEAARKSSAA